MEHFYSSYAFVASPVGRGVDCHRTYEILLMGEIPIIQKVQGFTLFDDHNLPVVQVDEWGGIDHLRLAYWAKKYGPLVGQSARQKLTMKYWFPQLYESIQE